MTVIDETSETEVVLSPGELLRQARERANLTEQEVALTLHMSVSKVRAIESDDYTKLNADTFIRGYLRSYAALLKLDSGVLVAAYEQQAIARGDLPSMTEIASREASVRKPWIFIVGLIGLFALLLLVSVWFFGNRIAPAPARSPAPAEDLNTVLPQTGQESTEVAVVVEDSPTEDSAVEAEAIELVAQNQQAAPLDRLQLAFTEECWLEVSDAQGDVLATELQRPGSRLSLQGRAPFEVKLGNAAAASISFNDEPVTIAPPTGSNVITLKVGS